ncbi:hypothetical protein FQA39_LY08880 [Lamprigera yunnana]|nr:hypothetical protein FQA39_LY08880 [Lamprigera yunnana]
MIMLNFLKDGLTEVIISSGIYLERLANISFYQTTRQILFRYKQPQPLYEKLNCKNFCLNNGELYQNQRILEDDGELFDYQFATRNHVKKIFTKNYEISILLKGINERENVIILDGHYPSILDNYIVNMSCSDPKLLEIILLDYKQRVDWTRSFVNMCQTRRLQLDIVNVNTLRNALVEMYTIYEAESWPIATDAYSAVERMRRQFTALAFEADHKIVNGLRSRSSVVSTKSSAIASSNLSSRNNKFEYLRDYLNRYGYFNGQDGLGFIFSLNKFQEYYKLEITKTINDETLKVMETPRCGMADIAAPFNLKEMFRRKNPILWHFRGGTNKQIKLATVSFQLWEKYANINFQQSFENPNIIISFKYKDHLKERDSKRCGFTLDNGELAHAFFPPADSSVSEIHVKQNKDWNEEHYDISQDKLSLLITLANEIGQAIGTDHSPIYQSLIHSVYHELISPFNAKYF